MLQYGTDLRFSFKSPNTMNTAFNYIKGYEINQMKMPLIQRKANLRVYSHLAKH